MNAPTVTGTVRLDLTSVAADNHRQRVAALTSAPIGANVELIVGPLAVGPEAARWVRHYAAERRLVVNVKGEPWSVARWLSALRDGEICGELL